ncbi:MAG: hypothetical protein Kow0037_18290 [Calditrichia bacterium]
MAEFEKNTLGKLIKESDLCPPEQVAERISQHFADEEAVGIIEAVSQVFWVLVKNGGIQHLNGTQKEMTDPDNWLSVRVFNQNKELRFIRQENGMRMTLLDDHELEEKEDYRETEWLLAGKREAAGEQEQKMEEFAVKPYNMPLTRVKTPKLKVRQYIDYDKDTGLAKIVAERLVKLGEEENNG